MSLQSKSANYFGGISFMSDQKVSLLFVITELYRGGAEVALINLLKKLDREAYSVDLLILSQKPNNPSLVEEVPSWVQVCDAGIINWKSGFKGATEEFLNGGDAAQRFVEHKEYDIAFSYGEWCRLGFVANHVNACEKAIWIHTDIASCPTFREEDFFATFTQYRYYIFVSETTRKNAVSRYPFLEKKTVIIHNTLDLEELKRLSKEKVADIPFHPGPKLITVANIRGEKGYQRILETAVELKKREFDFQWLCIGKFSDETLTQKLRTEIDQNQLSDNLLLLGPRENPHPYSVQADLFVLLSDYEAWPLAMAEAMLLGTPAVATKTAGSSEQIRNNENGLLVTFEIKEIAETIEKYFNNTQLRKIIKDELKLFKNTMAQNVEFTSFVQHQNRRRQSSMIERLDFSPNVSYNATEASIHLNRYAMVKTICKDKRVLDIASGEGYGSFLMKRWGAAHVDAIDIDAATVKTAKELFGSEDVCFQCHEAENLPFQSHSFDLITSFETIEHLDRPEDFLNEIKRVLKPGGTIILSCPNDPYYYKTEDKCNPFHKRKYTWFDFKELAEKHLGNHVRYYLGFAADGFLNIPMEKSTEPDKKGLPAPNTMFELLNYTECSSSLFLESDRFINHWNSNYYVGIWGAIPSNFDVSSVIFPREFFVEHKDEDVSLRKEVKIWENEKKKMENLLAEKEVEIKIMQENAALELDALKEYQNYKILKDYKDLKQECETAHLEADRLSLMLELVTKEKECLSQSASINYNQFMQVKTELDIMKSTKGYKLLNLIYRIRCKVRAIFH